jgi:hypothetical protein
MIYNEGFCKFAGTKHPNLMGSSPVTEYAEVWDMFVDIIDRGRKTGEATRHNDVQLFLNRHGYLEECYVTYNFIPLLGTDKSVVGFYHTALETTNQVIGARRTRTMLSIGDAVASSRSIQDYWKNLLKVLEDNNDDMHWALAYSFSQTEGTNSMPASEASTEQGTALHIPRSCTLAGATIEADGKVPLSFDYRNDNTPFVQIIRKSMHYGETLQLDKTDPNLPSWIFESSSNTKTGEPCVSALLIPIRPTMKNDKDGHNVVGFLIVGLSPCLRYDEDFAQFVHLCSRQLGTSAASIMLLEQEISRQRQLTKELSSSHRQAHELEAKLTRFTEISNIGM